MVIVPELVLEFSMVILPLVAEIVALVATAKFPLVAVSIIDPCLAVTLLTVNVPADVKLKEPPALEVFSVTAAEFVTKTLPRPPVVAVIVLVMFVIRL